MLARTSKNCLGKRVRCTWKLLSYYDYWRGNRKISLYRFAAPSAAMTLSLSTHTPFAQIRSLTTATKRVRIPTLCPVWWHRSNFTTTSIRTEEDAQPGTPFLLVSCSACRESIILITWYYRPELPTLVEMRKEGSTE